MSAEDGWRRQLYERVITGWRSARRSTRRAVAVVLVVMLVGALLWFVGAMNVQDQLNDAAIRYASALERGDFAEARTELCTELRATTTEADLSRAVDSFGGIDDVDGGLRGTHTRFGWPLATAGQAGLRLERSGDEIVRIFEMRKEGGTWKTCPNDSLLGRRPR